MSCSSRSDPARRWTYDYDAFGPIDFLLVSRPLKDPLDGAGVVRRGISDLEALRIAASEPSRSDNRKVRPPASNGGISSQRLKRYIPPAMLDVTRSYWLVALGKWARMMVGPVSGALADGEVAELRYCHGSGCGKRVEEARPGAIAGEVQRMVGGRNRPEEGEVDGEPVRTLNSSTDRL